MMLGGAYPSMSQVPAQPHSVTPKARNQGHGLQEPGWPSSEDSDPLEILRATNVATPFYSE